MENHHGNVSQYDNAQELNKVEDIETMWRTFDSLPFQVRAMIAIAPYQFSVLDVAADFRRWQQGQWFTSRPDVREYAASMDRAFRDQVKELSYSKEEYNGSYKLVRKIPKVKITGRKVQRYGSGRNRRHNGIFPPIPTRRGTEINYG